MTSLDNFGGVGGGGWGCCWYIYLLCMALWLSCVWKAEEFLSSNYLGLEFVLGS